MLKLLKNRDLISFFIIFILALVFSLDLFLVKYQPQTFDEPIHITTLAQYYQAIKDGDFPVVWTNGFANYGYPLGIISHQVTSYLGALINFLTQSPLLSYTILVFLSSLLLGISFFIFLKIYFNHSTSIIGASFVIFSAYRIFDIYVRGALPEMFSIIFFILSLKAIYQIFSQYKYKAIFLLIIWLSLMILSHPMMAIIYLPIISLYFIFNTKIKNGFIKNLLIFFACIGFSLLISSHYLIPLKLENKYFVMAQSKSNISSEQFLTWENYFSPAWYYYKSHPGPRGNFIKFGLIETILLLSSVIFYRISRDIKHKKLFLFSAISSILLILLTMSISQPIYKLPFLREIQFPWRVLTPLMIFPAVFLCFYLDKVKNKYIYLVILGLILVLRVPQLYSKNVVNFSNDRYYMTKYNLHTDNLNLVWMGSAKDYQSKTKQAQVIAGEGEIVNLNLENSRRDYLVVAKSELRIVDYTFYYPGWNVYINGNPVDIEYQDPEFRGIITYNVPQGEHEVKVVFEDTKIRRYAKIISIGSLILTMIMFFVMKYNPKLEKMVIKNIC